MIQRADYQGLSINDRLDLVDAIDAAHGRGKRGGARVHYLYIPRAALIYLMFVYGKQEQSTLTPQQKRALKSVVEAIIAEWDDSGSERGGRR